MSDPRIAVITGYGPGLGAELATRLATDDYTVVGLSRTGREPEGGKGFACDMADPAAVQATLAEVKADWGAPRILVHNVGMLVMSPFEEIALETFEQAWRVNCFGGMAAAQALVGDMAARGDGVIVFSGATASVKGSANFSAFASAKFALRGLSQALARTYGPQGVHVVHTVLDGVIWGARAEKKFGMDKALCMDPSEIADVYMGLINQQPSAWTWEADLRPYSEKF